LTAADPGRIWYFMKSFRIVSVALILSVLVAASSVEARGGHGGGGHAGGHFSGPRGGGHHGFHHHGFHHRHHGAVIIGGPAFFWWGPAYPYPYWWDYPSAPAPVYVEPPVAGYWYYCRSARDYYPTVLGCPEGWIRVPPRSP
jgi:hypothetical protein